MYVTQPSHVNMYLCVCVCARMRVHKMSQIFLDNLHSSYFHFVLLHARTYNYEGHCSDPPQHTFIGHMNVLGTHINK